jgi:hypothetical protein
MPRASFRAWHRRLGALAAIFVIVITATGLALNHSDGLKLDENFVNTGWLLDWYGVVAPDPAAAAKAGNYQVTLLADHLYVDETLVSAGLDGLVGALQLGDMLVVAAPSELVLITTPGLEIIERLGIEHGLPGRIEQLGLDNAGALAIRTRDGSWHSDQQMLEWRPTHSSTGIAWSEPDTAAAALASKLKTDYRSRTLTVEKIMLDLHSGRIVRIAGPWLLDAIGITLLLLAGTGLWLWLSGKR